MKYVLRLGFRKGLGPYMLGIPYPGEEILWTSLQRKAVKFDDREQAELVGGASGDVRAVRLRPRPEPAKEMACDPTCECGHVRDEHTHAAGSARTDCLIEDCGCISFDENPDFAATPPSSPSQPKKVMAEPKIDEAKMQAALKGVLEALNPLSKVERRRVLNATGMLIGEWVGKEPKDQGGQDDCG